MTFLHTYSLITLFLTDFPYKEKTNEKGYHVISMSQNIFLAEEYSFKASRTDICEIKSEK